MSARTALLLFAAIASSLSSTVRSETIQQHVHDHGGTVMPFDQARTVHVFRMTTDGGTQQVLLRDDVADPQQLASIREHLSFVAKEFAAGRFSDPARLHGADMPGLAELQAGAAAMRIVYRPLPNGGEIRFTAEDIALVTAIHRWFGAQLSEHGADARAR